MEKENNNRSIILHFAEEINAINDLAGIERSYLKNSKNLDKDICNMQVTLLTMCVNREIRISLDKNEDVKKFCSDIKHKYNKVNRNIVKDIKSSELSKKEKYIFERYLNKIVGCLLSGIKHEELNSYEREERVRDNMKGLITHNVADIKCTIEQGIEIPYMYILAWDLPNLYIDMGKKHFDYSKLKFLSKEKVEELNNASYIRKLHSNIIDYYSHISDNMIDILLHNELDADDEKKKFENMIDKLPNCEQYAADEESWEKKVNWNKSKNIQIKPFVFMKKISFEGLLPTIKYDDNGNIKYEHIACTYALKNCRNWIAHFKITQKYDIKFVVFLFAISVKVLFEDNIVGKTYSTYESNMWSLFEIFPINMNKYEEISKETIINAYKKLCITAKNNGYKNKDSSNAYIEPQKLFVYLGGEKSKYILTQGDVAASFWLSLHMRSCTEAEKIVFKNIPQKDINAYLIGIANIIQKESIILNM